MLVIEGLYIKALMAVRTPQELLDGINPSLHISSLKVRIYRNRGWPRLAHFIPSYVQKSPNFRTHSWPSGYLRPVNHILSLWQSENGLFHWRYTAEPSCLAKLIGLELHIFHRQFVLLVFLVLAKQSTLPKIGVDFLHQGVTFSLSWAPHEKLQSGETPRSFSLLVTLDRSNRCFQTWRTHGLNPWRIRVTIRKSYS